MSDAELFAIENWLRRSDIDVPPGKREQVARAILFNMKMERQKRFFEKRAIPRGIVSDPDD